VRQRLRLDLTVKVSKSAVPPRAAIQRWAQAAVGRAAKGRDLVICPEVLRSEAKLQGKTMHAHWAHLIVHGSLHLIGYDHETSVDAPRMERREVKVLRKLGFDNPYLSTMGT
jgi:rRNA maturation RNase YbeY